MAAQLLLEQSSGSKRRESAEVAKEEEQLRLEGA